MTRKDAENHLAYLARRRERYAARKKAQNKEPEQLALFTAGPPRKPTSAERREMTIEERNLGRAWLKKIIAKMEG